MSNSTPLFVSAIFLFSILAPSALSQETNQLVFIDMPSEVSVDVGSSSIIQVVVKNTAEYSKTAELGIETAAQVSVSIVPGTVVLGRGESATFTLSFLSSQSNQINRYPSKIKLSGGVEKGFTILVLPTAGKKFEINNDYIVLLNKYENSKKRFEQVKDSGCVLVEAGDVNAVTPRQISDSLQNLNDNVEKTRIAIKENDFLTASIEQVKGSQLADKVESDINSLRGSQESCENEKLRVSGYLTGGAIGTAAGLIIIVVIIGAVVYNHYTRLPRVRKLIRSESHYMKPKSESNMEGRPGVTRAERDFKYEFRKKK